MVEDEIGHLDMCWADRREVLPEPTAPLDREPSSPSNGAPYAFIEPVPHPTDFVDTDLSAPPPVRSLVRDRSPDRALDERREGSFFSSPQRPPAHRANDRMKATGRKLRKQVSFSNLAATHEVIPYSEIYGDHPRNFHFDSNGNMVSNSSLIQDWGFSGFSGFQGFQAQMFGDKAQMFEEEAKMFDTYNRRYRMDDHMAFNESESLF
eukprot:CAMPEP_0169205520 /NCGR_PEP_ID=MMETSP1016-20121227/12558_1 /TAXON_ID=342587 /ORGANISM="Karlodinium micrum, Strain CCMP2283" /LENGTH=206 /DNA_ID=CAMNT_0009282665 /DNA_START=12 /DNA_END=632 /DNA_ORIENTATION=-